MARFSHQFINQVAQANDIGEVVGQYIALKKRGREFLGLCPFHDDHRPSLTVSPAKQIFKCFVCGAGGGIFQFLMQHQKRTFPEAVRELAERAGIPVPAEAAAAEGDRALAAEALVRLTTFAARFFRDRLFSPAGAAALEYARRRRLTDESIRRFGLGYAPDSWEALRSAALEAGFTDRQLAAAGLGAQREDGSCYDRFRNRLIFPILDVAGKVIAFGGRALDAREPAKYLNSPETVLFDKSANLYALNWARQEIVKSNQAVVVEGYLDALMCLQEGIGNVVATLGTALTERHVRMLSRYAGDVVLVFDADVAGQAAAERAIELFLTQRVNVRVATVLQADEGEPQVKDPYDYVLAAGAEAMRALLGSAPDALEYAWSRRRDQYLRAPTLAGKRTVVEEFLRLVVSSAAYGAIDTLRQGLIVGQIGELVGLPPAQVGEQMRRMARRVGRASAAGQTTGGSAESADRSERWLLGVLLNEPALFKSLPEELNPGMFDSPALKAVAEQVWHLAAEERLDLAALLGTLEVQQWGRLVTDLQIAAEKLGNYEGALAGAAEGILRRHRRGQLAELKARRGPGDAELMRRISEEGRKPDRRRRPRLS
jgi:DNA primase